MDRTPDIKGIVKRIQKKREQRHGAPKNEPSKNINDRSDIEVYELGLKAISRKLGPVGIVRFVHLFDADKGTDAPESYKRLNADE